MRYIATNWQLALKFQSANPLLRLAISCVVASCVVEPIGELLHNDVTIQRLTLTFILSRNPAICKKSDNLITSLWHARVFSDVLRVCVCKLRVTCKNMI